MVRLNTGRSGVEVPVAHEIALAFELHDVVRMACRDGGLDPGVLQDFQRLRIEVGGEVAGVRRGLCKQLVVDADLGGLGLRGRQPVHGGLDLAAVGRVAAFGRGIVGAAQFDHFAARVLDDPVHLMK